MSRSKYINTFNTTADYENYIESAVPEFPNIGYDKQAGKVKITRTSPNDHLFYGELVDATQALPTISLDGTVNTPTLDTLNNMFYLDSWTNTAPTSITINNKTNIKSIKKWKGLNTSNITSMIAMFQDCSSLTSLDLSNFVTSKVTNMLRTFNGCSSLASLDLSNFDVSGVTHMLRTFNDCSSLTSLDLSNWDASNVGTITSTFDACSSLTDVYITVEATLMKFTNNLTSQGGDYIPSNNGNCTIHYNDVDYKWQNNAWTPQS